MGDLTFYHGTMGSGKSAKAIDRITTLRAEADAGGGGVSIPAFTGFSREFGKIKSRDGRSVPARNLVPGDRMHKIVNRDAHTVIVDEAQFLTAAQAESLAILAGVTDTHVECFGLLTDFRRRLFPGAARLVELADYLKPLDPIKCAWCRNLGVVNARVRRDLIELDGPQVQVGDVGYGYAVLCNACYTDKKNHAPKTAEVYS